MKSIIAYCGLHVNRTTIVNNRNHVYSDTVFYSGTSLFAHRFICLWYCGVETRLQHDSPARFGEKGRSAHGGCCSLLCGGVSNLEETFKSLGRSWSRQRERLLRKSKAHSKLSGLYSMQATRHRQGERIDEKFLVDTDIDMNRSVLSWEGVCTKGLASCQVTTMDDTIGRSWEQRMRPRA